MVFSFTIPTTSHVAFQNFISSDTHPSLPSAATTSRGVVRQALKRHKRLPANSQSSHLNDVFSALNEYVPYLIALDAGLGNRSVADEELQVDLVKEIKVEWRATLTAQIAGREAQRIQLNSFEYEFLFAMSTLATTQCLLARSQLHILYDAATPTSEQRSAAIVAAMRHFLDANAKFTYLFTRANQLSKQPPVPDISVSTFVGLASMCLAEATLLQVLKDDPYPAAVVQDRNKNDKEWMYKAPEIPKVRAHLFARLCLAAADHASKAGGSLGLSSKIAESLTKYVEDLRRTARGKACRFLGIDAELSGKTGEAIAWLNAAQIELGFAASASGGAQGKKTSGFSKLKRDFAEKREDRKVEKGTDWGSDAGRFEEGRVVDMLMTKWSKMNDLVNVQSIPAPEPLLANLPSGRECHTPKQWTVPTMDSADLARMRAPPDPETERYLAGGDESDHSDDSRGDPSDPVGAFPGTAKEYSASSHYY